MMRAGIRWVSRPFVIWGIGGYVVTTAILLVESLQVSNGHLVYLIDDPAIHLAMARTVAESGTWGIVPGDFQSASSSPLWTATLAVIWRIVPSLAYYAPIALNVIASLVVVVLLDRNQEILRPSRTRPLDGPAIVGLTVAVLFLPALTLLGMEHVVHMALVLAIVSLFGRCHRSDATRDHVPVPAWPGWPLVSLLAAASLVRFETAFLALGLAVATVADWNGGPVRRRLLRSTCILGASGVPIAAFATVNHLAGQGWLPNSVLAKGQLISNSATSSIALSSILNRLTTDPMLAVLATAGLVIAVAGWRRLESAVVAIAFAVTCMLHVAFAQVGWFERYQAYLIAMGLLLLLRLGTELRIAEDWAGAGRRSYRVGLAALLLLTLCATKISLTIEVPRGVKDTYQQRYQAARFLERYYDGQPIATGELGYIGLLHGGPITDLFGLGDYEVLQMRRADDQEVPAAQWERLARERGFAVAAVYPRTLAFQVPENWIGVGTWTMRHVTVTAPENQFQFWATSPEAVRPLLAHLKSFQSSLPPEVQVDLNPLATVRADILARQGQRDGS